MQSHSKFLLGDLLLREGLLTQEHVTHACEVQRTLTSPLPYGEVCLRLGFLSPDELAAILKKHHHRIPLGELLVHHGLVSATHVQTALARQRGSTKKLGALLVENGLRSLGRGDLSTSYPLPGFGGTRLCRCAAPAPAPAPAC